MTINPALAPEPDLAVRWTGTEAGRSPARDQSCFWRLRPSGR